MPGGGGEINPPKGLRDQNRMKLFFHYAGFFLVTRRKIQYDRGRTGKQPGWLWRESVGNSPGRLFLSFGGGSPSKF